MPNLLNFPASILQTFSTPTPYFLVVIFLFFVVFIYGLYSGRGKLIILLVSTYAAMVLKGLFPYQDRLVRNFRVSDSSLLEILLFLVALIISFYLLSRSPLKVLSIKGKDKSPIFQILFLTLLILGLWVTFIIPFFGEGFKTGLSGPFFSYLNTLEAQFWWAFAGLAYLALVKRRGPE